MPRTAPAIKHSLASKNQLYLALRYQHDQEKRVYVFNPELPDRISRVRNEIVELQMKLRKGGEPKHV